ncbi:UDP-N-acetylmuramoyl-tripeptide--D-alanyl-D-alanine ligase [Rhodovulum adriaticum]|uniref:UDP-N-acetylmuramoyl-tripeptide--D-alanyl-D-alanine ligase n=1 Tax=Rhodovulum adriaticum TaxID=35804 RepID=A0A4R2NVZ0_RHOAD|nr:UDP-N-acetylmuramoyl-tripeptide--D-alanyl-D-alanine ligase [Rhodovulum adriaticum]MBK1636308.1 UDP-N-acetylmuramoyl-tripeptide--D-alanyl-D-alanine ligase [Rhodovulum adriaticum]TCP26309.1 UDP-N-acetylmuramoyl-tripeptide--D-alanyl-D-alanine ligase [Rhodovulum adriaticum]
MSTLWTAAEAAAATGGRATCDWQASGVSIDTRSLAPGDLFVALKDRRDGHEFVAAALAAGAAAALVSRVPEGVADDAPLLIVDDVLLALQALGRAGRDRTGARVVAVTGSVGKTSTKEMLRHVLAGQGRVHAAEASFNNHWGVPLTLARLPRDAAFAVVEIGMNHPGEIAPLTRLARPHVALITTIAPAHLAAFDDLAGIAREKASIFEGLAEGGAAIYPADLETSPILAAAAREYAAKSVTFGQEDGCDFRLLGIEIHAASTVVQARAPGQDLLFKIQSAGRHFAMNALSVLAAVESLGIDGAVAACDLAGWVPPAGRGARLRIALDVVEDQMMVEVIDDAFNANPASVAAALEVLAAARPQDGVGRVARGRRIAILGDMLELGPDEQGLHAGLADLPAMAQVDLVHCVGPRMRALYFALPLKKRGQWFDEAEPLADKVHHMVDAGDVVLVKGSKGSRVSAVVDALKKLGQAVPAPQEDPE